MSYIDDNQDKDGNSGSIIIPHRFIPFDLGAKIDENCARKIEKYCDDNNYIIKEITGLLKSISSDILFKIEILSPVFARLYIYSYGVGVFMLEDDLYSMGEKYAVEYCDYRKKAHKNILEFNYDLFSDTVKRIISDLRLIVGEGQKSIRPSANDEWEYNGLSYVMTVSYIIRKDQAIKDYTEFTEIEKKDLQIMLQPSIAHKEDTMAMKEMDELTDPFDPYNFAVDKIEIPKNWIKSEDCSIYISWAAVIVYLKKLNVKYMEILEYLEVDLQAMWLYTYCQYLNLRSWSNKKFTSAQLKRKKYYFQRKYNEFVSNNDSSIPVYILEIRNELINTSGIANEKDNYVKYLDYCIDETESIESEQQRKYAVMNEVLLFIIAFIQIAPMLYDVLDGNFEGLHIRPIAIMSIVVVAAVYFIIKKD